MAVNLFGRQAVFSGDGDDLDNDADRLDIPIHAFDVIIADECHRGYTTAELSLWRNTLDHFDAVKIGLTATPAAHTKAYFHDVIYRYEYSRAVREGWLVDYDVVNIKSDVRIRGIFLKEADRVELVDPDTGNVTLDQLEDERSFASEEIERQVTSPDSNRKILQEIRRYALQHEETYGRFPKTLIFADNDLPHTSHADQLVELAAEIFGQGQSFVRKITGRVDRPLQAIRKFRNRPEPALVVTVDLLSTGVDIPDLEFIVFLRQVKSRILFEQMLGRGTRKGERLLDKSHFTVFDCFDGGLFHYFSQATAITAEPPIKAGRTIVEIIDDIWDNQDRDYNMRCLVRRLQRIDKEMSGEARERFKAHGIPHGDLSRYAAQLPSALKKDFTGSMRLLRDKSFQKLLLDFPRRKRTFLRATEYEDAVESDMMLHDILGHEIKPEEYLTAFSRFVAQNPAQIDAIEILLNRPRDWNTAALIELKKKLSYTQERFTIENLQTAHQLRYHKALADIISMVKHAALEQEPLLNAEERVDRAMRKIFPGKSVTQEQRDWLEKIRAHLVHNLSIELQDFELMQIFERAGGLGRARKVFGTELEPLIAELNAAVAA